MTDSDDDEQLRRAIALSLLESSSAPNNGTPERCSELPRTVIDLTDSAEDKVSISASCVGEAPVSAIAPTAPTSNTPILGILGLNRKEMEEQRLARKRKASISPPATRRMRCRPEEVKVDTGKCAAVTPPPLPGSGVQYPKGVVKKTWALGFPREHDIKIEEVLQKVDLQLAVLSAYQWDVDWLLRKISLNESKMVFVMQAKEDAVKREYERDTAGIANMRLCFPSMDGGVNCMHSKLMLLSHPNHLRIVVPSANLVPYDWGETGIMENTVFLIDLPRLDGDERTTRDSLTFFGKELVHFLEAMGLQQEIVDSVYQFDFSETKGLAFVHSIGGPHVGEEWRRTGYCGLGKAVRMLGLQHEDPLEVHFVTSSIGSLNDDFLKMIYLAAKGDDGLTEYGQRYSQASKSKSKSKRNETRPEEEVILPEQIKENFRIYFPTKETVLNSKGGPSNGGTICFQSKWYESATFPRHLMRDCRSQRAGLLMHNKILFARRREASTSMGALTCPAWAYIGSANLSESAWGRLVENKTTKRPKLTCRNWECGVLIPVHNTDVQAEVAGSASRCSMDVFRAQVPVPMRYPGEEYGTRKPWYFTQQ